MFDEQMKKENSFNVGFLNLHGSTIPLKPQKAFIIVADLAGEGGAVNTLEWSREGLRTVLKSPPRIR